MKLTGHFVKIDEAVLVFLLDGAAAYANYEEFDRGYPDTANEMRAIIRNAVFHINHQVGFEKYYFDYQTGVRKTETFSEESNNEQKD